MPVDLTHPDTFVRRHIGPSEADIASMLSKLGVGSLGELARQVVPATIRLDRPLDLPAPLSERELLALARELGAKNLRYKSYLGQGFSDCVTPPVILRNVLESPGWYTQYTPYQAEISQGRLEALLNFQTMITDLTALPVANASLLDEATAAAEAVHLCWEFAGADGKNVFFVADGCHATTVEVVRTRAAALGIEVVVGDPATMPKGKVFGALCQYPTTDGRVGDVAAFTAKVHAEGALAVVAADILSLAILEPPGALGADVAVGNTQRFGVPLGYGGPHAAYFACKTDYVRKLPGRIIGVSVDRHDKPAYRMALQTREQHIRREKATSNICTAQALLAIVASMYAVYHGPDGIRRIAERVHGAATTLAHGLRAKGVRVVHDQFFDTVCIAGSDADVGRWLAQADERRINLRKLDATHLTISVDETTTSRDLDELLAVFGAGGGAAELATAATSALPASLRRTSTYLTHPVFNRYHSETEMLRYLRTLEGRDLSLCHSMIPLGSCTMKLNATVEMMPVTDPAWGGLHPFAPPAQAEGYRRIFRDLEAWLAEITGFSAVSLQPNAGSQGEYAGLLVIRRWHEQRGQAGRRVCLIPSSAHGTNPASAVMAGLEVVVVKCDDRGNVDVADLEAKAKAHADDLAALMVTYPSTHGVFEEKIRSICDIVHAHGGQVYLDGANMNAQVGLCRPGDFGADVCHINLHKTFCIPHGGGGPGMGPIAVAPHLAKLLPRHPLVETGGADGIGPVAQAPWGSASILLISWAYIRMMGAEGLRRATEVAILNANYVAASLADIYPVVYAGAHGRVAHECILETRPFKKSASIEVEDIAKRLMDYGFHAPTMSFPIPGTLMVEPTESESKEELDRFCDALRAIRGEIGLVETGKLPHDDNPLKNAPHTAEEVTADAWSHPYSRQVAAFPSAATRARKFWTAVARINNAYGDRNLVCTCPPLDAYAR